MTDSQPAPNSDAETGFEPELLARIHDDALRVLEEVGVKCTVPEVRQIFEETGLAAFDETTGHLYVLRQLVEQALAQTPGRSEFFIPENSFGVGGTAPFVYDHEINDLRQPTLADTARIASIVDASDEAAFMARGVLIKDAEVEVIETITANCHKPVYVGTVTEAGLNKAQEVFRDRGNLVVQFSIINSPLNIIDGMIPPFLKAVRMGLPVYVSTMPMAGLTAPYSMSGLVTLTHAEGLFGITLAQLVNPGMTLVHAGLPSIANVSKKYAVDLGLQAHHVANILQEKVNQRLGLPSIQTACTTNEDFPGPRAEQDAIDGFALCKKYGFHQMRHAFGFLRELVSFSIEKLERHLVLCRETTPDQAPEIEPVVYDPEGFTAIARNGSQAGYMSDAHTLKNTGLVFVR
jgi:trimethylamine:corrinoid methyltransferase-like protein